MSRILVVDDDPAIQRALQRNLRARGYDIWLSESGEAAIRAVDELDPHLLVLDLMLPGLSGIAVCRVVRKTSSVPILVLSAKGDQRAKVEALDTGADDYLTKPFGMDELLARVRALLRRQPELAETGGIVDAGWLRLDLAARTVTKCDARLDLTAREFDVLAFLMRNQGKVVTHRQLLAAVWGPEYFGETHYLRVFINRLRRKIEDDPAQPRYILTDSGVGYRMASPA